MFVKLTIQVIPFALLFLLLKPGMVSNMSGLIIITYVRIYRIVGLEGLYITKKAATLQLGKEKGWG